MGTAEKAHRRHACACLKGREQEAKCRCLEASGSPAPLGNKEQLCRAGPGAGREGDRTGSRWTQESQAIRCTAGEGLSKQRHHRPVSRATAVAPRRPCRGEDTGPAARCSAGSTCRAARSSWLKGRQVGGLGSPDAGPRRREGSNSRTSWLRSLRSRAETPRTTRVCCPKERQAHSGGTGGGATGTAGRAGHLYRNLGRHSGGGARRAVKGPRRRS